MSHEYNSRDITNEAIEELDDHIESLHDFTKAILAVLERHGFLLVVKPTEHEEWCDIFKNVGGCSCTTEART